MLVLFGFSINKKLKDLFKSVGKVELSFVYLQFLDGSLALNGKTVYHFQFAYIVGYITNFS